MEYGLAEDAKSMRGREPGEKKPVWTPLILDRRYLSEFPILDTTPSMIEIHHERTQDGSYKNDAREYLEDEPAITDEGAVTLRRCQNY